MTNDEEGQYWAEMQAEAAAHEAEQAAADAAEYEQEMERMKQQTAEEAAREWYKKDVCQNIIDDVYGIRSSWLVWAGMNNGGDAIKKGYELGFERGIRWAQEREKVLGARWVIVDGNNRLLMRTAFTTEDSAKMEILGAEGLNYRAVKVKLVEVPE